MLTIVILALGSVTCLVVFLLAIVVIGIRQEPPTERLSELAPTPTAVFVRRMLGVTIRRPDSLLNPYPGDKSDTSLRTTPLVVPMDKRNLQ